METLLNILIIVGAVLIGIIIAAIIIVGALHLLFRPVYAAEKAAGAAMPPSQPPPSPHPADGRQKKENQ